MIQDSTVPSHLAAGTPGHLRTSQPLVRSSTKLAALLAVRAPIGSHNVHCRNHHPDAGTRMFPEGVLVPAFTKHYVLYCTVPEDQSPPSRRCCRSPLLEEPYPPRHGKDVYCTRTFYYSFSTSVQSCRQVYSWH